MAKEAQVDGRRRQRWVAAAMEEETSPYIFACGCGREKKWAMRVAWAPNAHACVRHTPDMSHCSTKGPSI